MTEIKDQEFTTDDGTPTAELTAPSPATGTDDAVWLVSFSDDDDRELKPHQIAEALRLGEINAETIVWRQGAADWLPLASVPELAKLMSSSGETATAPLVAPNPALLRRAKPEPKPTTAVLAEKPATTSIGGKPTIAGRAVPAAKGTTKLGLPRVEPKKAKADGTPLPTPGGAAPPVTGTAPVAPSAKKEPVVPAARPVAPSAAKAAPAPSAAKAAPAPSAVGPTTPTGSKARTSNPDIWGSASAEEEEAPISIEPELLRPPSPAPARAMQRAKALSAGTLGVTKKKPPAPPRPPEKRGAADVKVSPVAETPSLGTLATPVATASPAVVAIAAPVAVVAGTPTVPLPRVVTLATAEELLKLAAPGLPTAAKAAAEEPVVAPAFDVSALVAEPNVALASEPIETASTTPTESIASIAVTEDSAPPSTDAGAKPAAKPTRKGALPLVAAIAAVVLLAWLFMHGKRTAEAPRAELEPPSAPARPAAPPPASDPAQPAAAEPAAAEAPATAPETAAAAAPPPAAEQPTPATPATPQTKAPMAKADLAAKAESAQAPKSAEPKPGATKAQEPKAEPKPEPKPSAPEPKEVAVGGDFDKSAAATALGGAAQEASNCRKEGDPSGVAVVHVTFSNAGRATRAVIEGPPFAGTQTGGCIASTLRKATVPPYGGERVTVTKRVVIH